MPTWFLGAIFSTDLDKCSYLSNHGPIYISPCSNWCHINDDELLSLSIFNTDLLKMKVINVNVALCVKWSQKILFLCFYHVPLWNDSGFYWLSAGRIYGSLRLWILLGLNLKHDLIKHVVLAALSPCVSKKKSLFWVTFLKILNVIMVVEQIIANKYGSIEMFERK